jgi:hypothetical protein
MIVICVSQEEDELLWLDITNIFKIKVFSPTQHNDRRLGKCARYGGGRKNETLMQMKRTKDPPKVMDTRILVPCRLRSR